MDNFESERLKWLDKNNPVTNEELDCECLSEFLKEKMLSDVEELIIGYMEFGLDDEDIDEVLKKFI